MAFVTVFRMIVALPLTQAPKRASSVAADVAQQPATWTLNTVAKSTGEIFSAWLSLPPSTRPKRHFLVDLQFIQNMELWVPKDDGGCRTNNGVTHLDSTPPEGVIRVCAIGKEPQSVRLVATFREVG